MLVLKDWKVKLTRRSKVRAASRAGGVRGLDANGWSWTTSLARPQMLLWLQLLHLDAVCPFIYFTFVYLIFLIYYYLMLPTSPLHKRLRSFGAGSTAAPLVVHIVFCYIEKSLIFQRLRVADVARVDA